MHIMNGNSENFVAGKKYCLVKPVIPDPIEESESGIVIGLSKTLMDSRPVTGTIISIGENSEYNKLEQSIAELRKNQGIMYSDFMKAQRKHDEDMLKVFLMSPVNRQAYANKYKVEVDSISLDDGTAYNDPRNANCIPDSLFNDFYKDDTEIGTNSIYNSLNSSGQDMNSILDDQIH